MSDIPLPKPKRGRPKLPPGERKPPVGGAAHIRATGKRRVLILLTPSQHEAITAAAKADGRPLAQYVRRTAEEAAKKSRRA